jgi:hypothetical protein
MLDKRISQLHKRYVMALIILESLILGLYVSVIVFFTFHILLFISYVFIVFVSMIIFTTKYIKLQTYFNHKHVKVSNPMNDTLELNIKHIDKNQLPYFMYKKQKEEIMLKQILELSYVAQTLEIVAYDKIYACVKDSNGNEYITYVNQLELV